MPSKFSPDVVADLARLELLNVLSAISTGASDLEEALDALDARLAVLEDGEPRQAYHFAIQRDSDGSITSIDAVELSVHH